MQPASHQPGFWKPAHSPWLVAFSVLLTTFMQVLDTSVANVSLPHIAGGLSASTHEVSWVLTSYLVAGAIMLAASSWLSVFVGRKRYMAICVAVFTIASMLCGMAQTLPQLILARILQGLGGGGLQPLAQAVLLESFPQEKRGQAMAAYGMGIIVAPIIGPLLGGWITDNYSWRWIFYINVPIGILGLVLQNMFLEDPPYLKRDSSAKIDYFGLALMVVGLGAFQLVIDKGQEVDWFADSWIRAGTFIFTVAFPLFAWWELRRRNPFMNLRLLKSRNLSIGTALMAVQGAVMMGSTAILPIFMQQLLGYPAFQSGLSMMPRGIGSMIAMIIVSKLISNLGNRVMIAVGFLGLAVTLMIFSGLNLNIAPSNILLPLFFNGLMIGFTFVPLTTLTMANLKQSDIQQASGIFSLLRNIGASIGISLMFTMQSRMAQVHQSALGSNISAYSQQFQSWSAQVGSLLADPMAAYGLAYRNVVRQAVLLSFMDCFRWLAYAAILAMPLIAFFKGSRHIKSQAEMALME
ncbi:MAG TPA: DHA2 family efflux MFS transporter permease subunit [Elusimicrobiales bacterium]|nr:DHA2 family efflux MFS transporter permease subunit [Elusimicrobiales bacterium]